MLDVLREAGMDVSPSCEAGHYGTCAVTLKRGQVEHQGTGLMEEEKSDSMLTCESRGRGRIVIEI